MRPIAPRQSLSEYISVFQNSPPPAAKKPRAKSKRPEDKLHTAVAKYLSAVIARPGVCSDLGVIWMSIETRGKRSMREGAANKSRGCIAGCPDIDLYFAGRAFKIELKAEKGELSPAQRALHVELARARVPVLEARSVEAIAAVLDTWGIPHRRAIIA
jgi:hypothetical protein